MRAGSSGDIPHCHGSADSFQSAPVLQKLLRPLLVASLLAGSVSTRAQAQEFNPPPLGIIVSVADQRLTVVREGGWIAKYRISTSRFGIGDSHGSYKTPLGQFRVCDKVGESLVSGTVIRHRVATSEVLPVNAAGRDPIVTRVIWLEGLEEQNRNAKSRGIYIHGTTEEKWIGKPVSWGCVRMRSRDVVEMFAHVPVGTRVAIIAGKQPKLPKYVPQAPPIIASNSTATQYVPDVAPRKNASNSTVTQYAPDVAPRKSEPQPGRVSGDPGAAQAMSGSILSAGLPGGPQKVGPLKQDSMKFQSWSAVTSREPDNTDKTAGTRFLHTSP
jgi:lipoprotein-anchoring transpeptidase ErfK/SrfK